jgi:hypothetical protein
VLAAARSSTGSGDKTPWSPVTLISTPLAIYIASFRLEHGASCRTRCLARATSMLTWRHSSVRCDHARLSLSVVSLAVEWSDNTLSGPLGRAVPAVGWSAPHSTYDVPQRVRSGGHPGTCPLPFSSSRRAEVKHVCPGPESPRLRRVLDRGRIPQGSPCLTFHHQKSQLECRAIVHSIYAYTV